MGSRFTVKLAWSEDPERREAVTQQVKELAEKDYETEVVGAELPVVLDFYVLESKACQALGPRFAAVAEKFAGKARFLKVSRQANAALAARLGVTAVPTLVFLKGGKEAAERLSGEDIQRTALKARVEAMLGLPVAKPAT
jgi:thioredoxin-like negative regulator of GroEL